MDDLWQKAERLIIDGTGTFSKKPSAYIEGSYPTHTLGGSGYSIIGTDKKRYIDWVCGLGANLTEIQNSFSIPHALEVDLAELVTSKFPCDKIKVLKTGSGACEAAIRYARAHTARNRVWGYSYHGWGNTFIAAESPGKGCYSSPYKKFTDLRHVLDEMRHTPNNLLPACFITEPCVTDMKVKDLQLEIREMCKQKGVLYVADEIVSGGRTLQHCFSNYWNLEPDILVLGKGLASSHPISFIGVRNFINTSDVFVSTTFSGDLHSMKSAIRTIKYLTDERIEKLWQLGLHLQVEFNASANKHGVDIQLQGYPTRAIWVADNTLKSIFWEQMLYRGHFCGAAFFISMSHTQDVVEKFLKDAHDILKQMSNSILTLRGKPCRPPFRRN